MADACVRVWPHRSNRTEDDAQQDSSIALYADAALSRRICWNILCYWAVEAAWDVATG